MIDNEDRRYGCGEDVSNGFNYGMIDVDGYKGWHIDWGTQFDHCRAGLRLAKAFGRHR